MEPYTLFPSFLGPAGPRKPFAGAPMLAQASMGWYYPLTTMRGLRRATFFPIPAPSTASTTKETSL